MMPNAVRAHLAPFGIITAQGPHKIPALIREIQAGEVTGLPRIALAVVECLAAQLNNLERQPMLWHRVDETSRRLARFIHAGSDVGEAAVA